MSDIVKLYLRLVENPSAARPFRDLADYYKHKGMTEEAAGFQAILDERFTDDTPSTRPDAQQPGHH